MYRSDDDPKNGPKIVAFVEIRAVKDGTPLDKFIDLSTAGLIT